MVAEISPGIFRCERFGCPQTVAADRPNNRRSRAQAQGAVADHERRNAIHIGILDLSTLPPDPRMPDARRTGFAIVMATLEGLEVLARKVLVSSEQAQNECSIWAQIAASGDLTREKQGRGRFTRPGSLAAAQRALDAVQAMSYLFTPPVFSFPS